MASPTLDVGEWVGIVGLIGAGIGAVVALFRRMHGRIDRVEDNMRSFDTLHAEHNTELAVLKTCQANTADRLEKIDETTRDTNQNLKELAATMTQVLLAIQAKP